MKDFFCYGEATSEEVAQSIEFCVNELLQDRPSDDRMRILEAISWNTAQAFGDGDGRHSAIARIQDAAERQKLLEHPAAAPLLAYMITAMVRFNQSRFDGDELGNLDTAGKRLKLAEAFCLVGKTGERSVSRGRRLDMAQMFASEFNRHLAEMPDSSPGSAAHKQSRRQARAASLRLVFLSQHQEQYDYENPTHKSRMTEIRQILRDFGCAAELDDEK
jgi:hypothetical protein